MAETKPDETLREIVERIEAKHAREARRQRYMLVEGLIFLLIIVLGVTGALILVWIWG